jgi:hypothetical protein
VESFGGDVGTRSRKDIDNDYDRYESNMCFKGLCEAK